MKSAYNLKGLFTKLFYLLLFFNCSLCLSCSEKDVNNPGDDNSKTVEVWLTDSDEGIYFAKQKDLKIITTQNQNLEIIVDAATEYQEMDGFGFALTGGSAYNLSLMSAGARSAVLTELFDTKANNIGVSYLRISIGASDLDAKVFSYNDLLQGQTDVNLEHFSIAPDKEYLIPVLKEILAINPDIKILGSPWSAPVWMKTNGNSVGGSLKTQYYNSYANYFVKYIQAMKEEGITIDAITVQNEPLHPGNNPSMYMTAEDQAAFVKNSIGPAFVAADIKTKIIVYDHNADRIDYPMTILNDPEARKFVDGSAFHLYGGQINSLGLLHNAHPDKNLYFTEQWVGAGSEFKSTFSWHIWNLVIGATRNWCKNVIEWNLAADENQDPHTDGGCDRCLGAITVTGDNITRNPAYYIIAHASKFVRPGSVRIESTLFENLTNVSFKTPDGKIVVIVLNPGSSDVTFNIKVGNELVTATLAPEAVGTFVW